MDQTTGRAGLASATVDATRPGGPNDSGHRAARLRLARASAQILMFGAGFLTILNAASPLHDVNTSALRATGAVTVLVSLLLAKLPWERHARIVSYGVVALAIGALIASDSWHHYSRND